MTTKLTEVEIKENETITLKCPAKNPSIVEMEWLQEGQPVEESAHFHVSSEEVFELPLILCEFSKRKTARIFT